MKTATVIISLVLAVSMTSCAQNTSTNTPKKEETMSDNKIKTKDKLKQELTPLQYQVTQCSATEPAFNNEYWDNHEKGKYKCVVCGNMLFDSETKYDSGTGWPSFYKAAADTSVKTKLDSSHWMVRTEVVCNKCGAHLGHLFDDGPNPTGMRYCMNSASLKFDKEGEGEKK